MSKILRPRSERDSGRPRTAPAFRPYFSAGNRISPRSGPASGRRPSEVIVDAHADQAGRETVIGSGQDVAVVREIHEQVFDLRRPVGREAGLDAGAGGPTHIGMALARQAESLRLQLAEGDAGRAIKQEVADRITGATPHGAEPGIGELPRRESVAGARQLNVRLAPQHELTGLPIVAALDAAREAGRA